MTVTKYHALKSALKTDKTIDAKPFPPYDLSHVSLIGARLKASPPTPPLKNASHVPNHALATLTANISSAIGRSSLATMTLHPQRGFNRHDLFTFSPLRQPDRLLSHCPGYSSNILMAGLTGLRFARHGQSNSGHADLDHHLHHHYPTHSPLRPLLNQLDLHNELHYAVRILFKTVLTSKPR